MRRARAGSLLLLLGSSATLVGCRPGEDPAPELDPGTVAVRLFDLAREDDPASTLADPMFGTTAAADRPPELLDALRTLRRFPRPSVLRVQSLAGPGEVHVDLECALAGGGAARFTVKLVREGPAWQLRWLEGPGVEWPRPRPSRDESLTTSSHPATPPR